MVDEELDKMKDHQDGKESVQMDIKREAPLDILKIKYRKIRHIGLFERKNGIDGQVGTYLPVPKKLGLKNLFILVNSTIKQDSGSAKLEFPFPAPDPTLRQ